MTLCPPGAGIRATGSHRRAIAGTVERRWQAKHPAGVVTRRETGVQLIPATAWAPR